MAMHTMMRGSWTWKVIETDSPGNGRWLFISSWIQNNDGLPWQYPCYVHKYFHAPQKVLVPEISMQSSTRCIAKDPPINGSEEHRCPVILQVS